MSEFKRIALALAAGAAAMLLWALTAPTLYVPPLMAGLIAGLAVYAGVSGTVALVWMAMRGEDAARDENGRLKLPKGGGR